MDRRLHVRARGAPEAVDIHVLGPWWILGTAHSYQTENIVCLILSREVLDRWSTVSTFTYI